MQKPNSKSLSRITRFHNRELHKFPFVIGELYLFHTTKKYCPSRSSLWGIYDKTEDGVIYLENSSFDLIHFKLWHRLPYGYHYSRRATRQELRDYMYNLGHNDSLSCLSHTNKSPIIHSRPRHLFTRMLIGKHNTTEGGLIAPPDA